MSKSFLLWMVKDACKQACTYGVLVATLGVVAGAGGCPQPIPFLLVVAGIVINLCDAIYAYIKYQQVVHGIEQDRVVRELKQ